MLKLLVVLGLFSSPAYAIQAGCTQTANLGQWECPKNATDWFELITSSRGLTTNVDTLHVSTQGLRTDVDAISVSTDSLAISTGNLQVEIDALSLSTDALAISTGNLETAKVNRAGDTMTGQLEISSAPFVCDGTCTAKFGTPVGGVTTTIDNLGRIKVQDGNCASGAAYGFGADIGEGLIRPASNSMAWCNTGVEAMRLTSVGLGIGVTPTNDFHIKRTADLLNVLFDGQLSNSVTRLQLNGGLRSGDGIYATFTLSHAGAGDVQIAGERIGATNTVDMIFKTENAGSFTEKMRITAAGNVGIGTDSPASTATLHVAGGISAQDVHFDGTALFGKLVGGVQNQIINNGFRAIDGNCTNPAYGFTGDPGEGLHRPAGNSMGFCNAGAEKMRLTTSGLGIGTSAPSHLLDVEESAAGNFGQIDIVHTDNTNGASHARYLAQVGGESGGDPTTIYTVLGAVTWHTGVDNSNGNAFSIGPTLAVSGATGITIETGGNVGIGTIAPATRLDVEGSTQFGSGVAKSTFTVTADLIMGGFTRFQIKTKAELEAITPTFGDSYGCSDCDNNVNVVFGTGTISGFDSLGIGGTVWH